MAANLIGGDETHEAVPWFWSDQHDYRLQIAYLPDEATEVIVRDIGDKGVIHIGIAEEGRMVAASRVGPGNAIAKDIRLFEMLIARRTTPDRATLTNISVNLKRLLRS